MELDLNCVEEEDQRRMAKDRADKIVLEAEKFRGDIAAPQGKTPLQNVPSEITEEIRLKRLLDNDDDFFHVTCHVDGTLKNKIRNGEFVELEKLLPKERGSMTVGSGVEDMDFKSFIQMIARGGNTYLGPSFDQNKEKKILSVRRWEQAFRVYAAIYTEAHPGRAAEIWQYVYTINTAALSFNWENVYFYDQTFRRLMEEKPWRSWSKTYTQGWNIAMHDSIGNHGSRSSSYNNGGGSKKKDWRDDCCWKYNKNRCKNNDCNYEHCCTYCGGWKHGFFNCRKRSKRSGGNAGSSSAQSQKREISPSKN